MKIYLSEESVNHLIYCIENNMTKNEWFKNILKTIKKQLKYEEDKEIYDNAMIYNDGTDDWYK